MWWVIVVIFLLGLSLSAITFLLQYYGFCPMAPVYPAYWAPAAAYRVQRKVEEPGLHPDIVKRLNSYENVNDIPHKAEIADSFTEDGECLICQEAMQSKKISQLPCGHIYHKECVGSWLHRKPTCPSCRTVITAENINGFPKAPSSAPDIEMGMVKPA